MHIIMENAAVFIAGIDLSSIGNEARDPELIEKLGVTPSTTVPDPHSPKLVMIDTDTTDSREWTPERFRLFLAYEIYVIKAQLIPFDELMKINELFQLYNPSLVQIPARYQHFIKGNLKYGIYSLPISSRGDPLYYEA